MEDLNQKKNQVNSQYPQFHDHCGDACAQLQLYLNHVHPQFQAIVNPFGEKRDKLTLKKHSDPDLPYKLHTSRSIRKPTLWTQLSVEQVCNDQCVGRLVRKSTVRTLRKLSTRISLSILRTDTFRYIWSFCFRNHYSIPLSA